MKETLAQLSTRLRQLRDAQGISQRDLAVKSGIYYTQVAMIESGVRPPTLRTLCKIADGLGVPVAELFNR